MIAQLDARNLSRRGVLGVLGLSALTSVAGCGHSQRFSVVLDWLFNVNHAALFAAQHTGAFRRAGLDVDIISPADPDSPSRLTAAGQCDLAVGYGDQINMMVDKGLPLVRVATLINRPLNSIMALGRSGIHSLADLKGRKVGISVGGVEEVMLDVMVKSAGLTPSDITVVRVNYQMVQALLSGRIDAAIGAFRNAEVLEVAAAGGEPVVFAPEDHDVPAYDELILVARNDRAGDPRIRRFIGAVKAGAAALANDPKALLNAYRAAHPEQDNKTLAAAWPITLSAIAPDPGLLDKERYMAFQAFCLRQAIITKSLPLDHFAVETA